MRILLGVTGSIAAYKAADVVRLMRAKSWDVRVIMTPSATQFIGELTLRTLSMNPVAVEMFSPSEAWKPEHVALADSADLFLIAPCTANVMAKLACGIADDLLTCVALACDAPLVLAPAMNQKMWDHPATGENLVRLKQRGVKFVDVESGFLACGTQGRGRMAEPEQIVEYVAALAAGQPTVALKQGEKK